MKKIRIIKIMVDVGMTVALLLLMPYLLIGDKFHEIIGTMIAVLFILHHILNRKWLAHLFCGKYTAYRILQTFFVTVVLVCMIGSVVSGIVMSQYVFAFLPIKGGWALARKTHMLCAYWGLFGMALHLGLHWNMMLGMGKKLWKKWEVLVKWLMRFMAGGIAVYGIYAFYAKRIADYLFLRTEFVFLDFKEPLWHVLLDYVAILCLFAVVGHYLGRLLLYRKQDMGRNGAAVRKK